MFQKSFMVSKTVSFRLRLQLWFFSQAEPLAGGAVGCTSFDSSEKRHDTPPLGDLTSSGQDLCGTGTPAAGYLATV